MVDGRHVFGVSMRDETSGDEHMIVAVAQATHPMSQQPAPLALPLTNGNKSFTVREMGPLKYKFARSTTSQDAILSGSLKISGDLIAGHGIPLPLLYPESAILLEIKSERTPNHG